MVDRRTFLAGMGAVAAAGGVARGAAPAGVRAKPLDEVDYADVVLLDGRARRQAEATLTALMAMDEDALLRPFRQGAGQTVAAHQFGGWYDWSPSFAPSANMTGFIPGHSFGQYVSALARAYAVTGDAAAKVKADRLVAAFAPTITPDFYKNYPIPAYTYDKIVIGLLDAHRFAGNAQALPLIGRATDAVLPYLPGRAVDRAESEKAPRPNMAFGWDETYTLPENLYLVAAAGGGDRYRAMARQYLLDRTYFEPLAAGRNVLAGRHAYSHVNAMASAMQSYLVDGGETHFLAARNGMDFVVQQSFATGGWGPNEAFVEADSAGLGHSLETTHRSFEAPCGCYGHFKVARYLMRATGDSRHGDAVERLFYNAALGLLPLQPNGAAFYYADYNELGAKTYYEYACPCCSGSIGQLTADYGKTAYLRDDEGLYVNLYTPSKATWRRRGEPALVLTQTGGYPLTDDVAMSVAAPRPVTMALRLRIPAWAGPATRVSVNGRAVAGVTPGRFLTIAREWRAGDTIALAIDRPLYTKAVDAHAADHVALMQGPLALFGTGERHALLTRAELASLRQDAPGGTDWSLQGGTGRQSFKPYFAIHPGEVTRLYQRVADPVRA